MSDSTPADNRPTNRLSGETSPYLLQHAYNPVDWYPWGEEAIQKARDEDRPIFLSIGYSACHWCHVMEHESFENAAIAAVMNERFVNIKVDREERPDLDQIYMNAVQLMTGRGGWPMSVFLTPDLKPFYGGTYFPPEARMGMPGFPDILVRVSEVWQERREELLESAEKLTAAISDMVPPAAADAAPGEETLRSAMQALLRSSDGTHGGFGAAPKFPHPMDIRLLLRCWQRFQNEEALDVVKLALDKMAAGGIYDQLGGGFHRYSTDHRWLVPHFEKMLYDNALLTSSYVEAYQATGDADYARIVRETLDYTLNEMTQPQGGFYSTQDADSEGVEGKFFVWSEQEIVELLGEENARLFNSYYDVTPHGNWEGHTILNRPRSHDEAAAALGIDPQELREKLTACRETLFAVRAKRIAPQRDDKVLVAWNGLMIAAMAQAGRVLGDERYTTAAVDAAEFVLGEMRNESGRLLHSYKDGRARFNAYLDDYACFVDGLVELYQATFEEKYLEAAAELATTMIDQFHEPEQGGFYYTSHDHEELITRQKDLQDSATPSGNSMAATGLLKLARLTGRRDLEEIALGTLRMLSGVVEKHPSAAGQALLAVDFLIGPTHEIVLVDGSDAEEGNAVLHELESRFLPNKVVVRTSASTSPSALLGPLVEGKTALENNATVFLCQQGTCTAPVGGDDFKAALDALVTKV
ncbi:Glycosyl Hydrolase Family 88 [Symmachiella dynata]|uniref:thioredoxin domain-containing protein n=1 Tax=Symmachiella dynata TaxID=2527995 RepID=UPI00118BC9A2|nr:thioredoxin domain-containing protein [Symmachiella dynata]QDT47336.1 Glycosyl Hydrolase Family 88 [Symmachiella dynata]